MFPKPASVKRELKRVDFVFSCSGTLDLEYETTLSSYCRLTTHEGDTSIEF
ncbi:predicted protein [Sclerotinia sclerotiorum 1980 UF-70]|uniref:Uncharacterized protein n=1 Tax=Sclerotinia sclerotiorum (strain ATCC 18683 / 1980 / Ss-1) TaxID=665079 RepID=A7F532_SCLS1|nr:predicted protein [Sclerotinia sclerotiorum 1980 UF-70]EDN97853.1 predicted protein [Sclerotinia sclerotiorum 1980 UF-70]